MFTNSVFLGVMITLGSYGIGMMLKRKTGWALMNPLLVAIVLVIAFLLLTGVSYKDYAVGSNCISYMLTPSTICLAVPLYQQMELLKKNSPPPTPDELYAGDINGNGELDPGDIPLLNRLIHGLPIYPNE